MSDRFRSGGLVRSAGLLVLLLTLVLLVAGCATQATPAPASAPATAPAGEGAGSAAGGDRLAIVLIGPANDNSWNEAAYNAGQALKERGVDVAVSESVSDADVARVLRQYAEEGYDLVVAHSFSYQDAVFQVAEEYPETNFAWAGGINRTGPNVADYDQPFYEGAYLVGLLAAHLTESGKLGALYGVDIPVCHSMGEAMLAGARTVREDVELIPSAVGDWGDVAKAKEAALAQADAGVDYWIECGEGPSLGAIEAAKEAGGYVTGYVGDMTELGPDVVASSVVWNLEPLFTQMLADTNAGHFADTYYRLGLKDGVIQVAVNPEIADQLGAEVLAALEAAEAGIKAGELEVPFVPE